MITLKEWLEKHGFTVRSIHGTCLASVTREGNSGVSVVIRPDRTKNVSYLGNAVIAEYNERIGGLK